MTQELRTLANIAFDRNMLVWDKKCKIGVSDFVITVLEDICLTEKTTIESFSVMEETVWKTMPKYPINVFTRFDWTWIYETFPDEHNFYKDSVQSLKCNMVGIAKHRDGKATLFAYNIGESDDQRSN